LVPQPFQRGLQLAKHAGGAKQQDHQARRRRHQPLRRLARAGQRLLDHRRALLAHQRADLRHQPVGQQLAVHPPAQQGHQQHQQRRQAQDAVERHRRAHAHAVGFVPEQGGAVQGVQGSQRALPQAHEQAQEAGLPERQVHAASVSGRRALSISAARPAV